MTPSRRTPTGSLALAGADEESATRLRWQHRILWRVQARGDPLLPDVRQRAARRLRRSSVPGRSPLPALDRPLVPADPAWVLVDGEQAVAPSTAKAGPGALCWGAVESGAPTLRGFRSGTRSRHARGSVGMRWAVPMRRSGPIATDPHVALEDPLRTVRGGGGVEAPEERLERILTLNMGFSSSDLGAHGLPHAGTTWPRSRPEERTVPGRRGGGPGRRSAARWGAHPRPSLPRRDKLVPMSNMGINSRRSSGAWTPPPPLTVRSGYPRTTWGSGSDACPFRATRARFLLPAPLQ